VHLRHHEPVAEPPAEVDPATAAIWRHDLRDAAVTTVPVIRAPHASELVAHSEAA
jgi:hypothetical protein